MYNPRGTKRLLHARKKKHKDCGTALAKVVNLNPVEKPFRVLKKWLRTETRNGQPRRRG